ncbi:hypothetical protein HK105_205173 [Polyrhizophydium stewartii]|uniref:Uncharacterized protein n=1 Tax=Polyrhizophydium stewartii TaxID=2732419 RepID=A0ABR4N6Z5_9FUNG
MHGAVLSQDGSSQPTGQEIIEAHHKQHVVAKPARVYLAYETPSADSSLLEAYGGVSGRSSLRPEYRKFDDEYRSRQHRNAQSDTSQSMDDPHEHDGDHGDHALQTYVLGNGAASQESSGSHARPIEHHFQRLQPPLPLHDRNPAHYYPAVIYGGHDMRPAASAAEAQQASIVIEEADYSSKSQWLYPAASSRDAGGKRVTLTSVEEYKEYLSMTLSSVTDDNQRAPACGIFGWALCGTGKKAAPPRIPANYWRASATSSLFHTFEQRMRESRYAKVAIVAGILILVIPALTLLSFLVLVWTGEAPYASVFKAVNQTVLQIATVTAAYITAHGIFGLWSVSRGSKRMMVWFAVLLVPTLAGQIALGYTSYKWINQPHFERRLTEQYQLMYTDETRQTIQTTVSLVVTCANFSSLTTLTVAQFNCCGLWSSFDYPVVDGVHCLQNLSPSQFNDTTGASGATGAAMVAGDAGSQATSSGISSTEPDRTSDDGADQQATSEQTEQEDLVRSKHRRGRTLNDSPGEATHLELDGRGTLGRYQQQESPAQQLPSASVGGCWVGLSSFARSFLQAFYTMAFVHLAVTIVVFVLSVLSINRIE